MEVFTEEQVQEIAEKVLKRYANKGVLVEGGWQNFRSMFIPSNAGDEQLNAMRFAFFSGAQYLFSSMHILSSDGDEVTEEDQKMMDSVSNELNEFTKEVRAVIRKGTN